MFAVNLCVAQFGAQAAHSAGRNSCKNFSADTPLTFRADRAVQWPVRAPAGPPVRHLKPTPDEFVERNTVDAVLGELDRSARNSTANRCRVIGARTELSTAWVAGHCSAATASATHLLVEVARNRPDTHFTHGPSATTQSGKRFLSCPIRPCFSRSVCCASGFASPIWSITLTSSPTFMPNMPRLVKNTVCCGFWGAVLPAARRRRDHRHQVPLV